jgi:hypothetical protein
MRPICDKKRARCNVGKSSAVLVPRGARIRVNRDNKWSSVIRSPKMEQARWRKVDARAVHCSPSWFNPGRASKLHWCRP